MVDITKIDCTTVITYRNTKTGETSLDKKEGPDIVQDCAVTVSPKGMNAIQKVMLKDEDIKST